jgi:hypothetical protein
MFRPEEEYGKVGTEKKREKFVDIFLRRLKVKLNPLPPPPPTSCGGYQPLPCRGNCDTFEEQQGKM